MHDIMINEKGDDEEKELESPWKGPSSVKDPNARRWMSSTAASLLDNQDEEDEDILGEPDLRCISETISEESRDGNPAAPPAVIENVENVVIENVENVVHGTVDSMVRLTEGMTGMLCPASLEGVDAVVAVQLKTHHRRLSSETDFLQRRLASGNCGSAAFCLIAKETGGLMKDTETVLEESRTMLSITDTLMNSPESPLDDDTTMLKSTETLKKSGAPSQCTDFNLLELRTVVATDILSVLGSSTGVAAEWFATLGKWLVPKHRESHYLPRRVFRNRCGVRTAQAQRMKELWYKWHSTAADDSIPKSPSLHPAASPSNGANPNMPPFRLWSLAVTKSLDDADWVAPATKAPHVTGPQSFSQDTNAPMAEVRFFTSMTPREPRRSLSPADLYYDSDPEIFRVARNSPMARHKRDDYIKKKPLRWRRDISMPAPIDTNASMGGKEILRPLTPKYVKGKGAPSFDAPSFDSEDRFDLNDDVLVKEFIKDLTTDKANLVWHPSPDANSTNASPRPSKAPVSVEGWFEMGSKLYNTVIQPKFMWRETYQPDLLNHKRLGMSCRSPHSLDLLNIIRILKPTSLDRSAYPFAKLDRTFTVLSHTSDLYVFQATNTEERDWMVHGLKLVVARLASMIIVGDEHMFVEFFSPWANAPMSTDSMDDQCFADAEGQESHEQQRPLVISTTDQVRSQLWGAW